jgi:CRISPR-associated protein Cmr5
MKNLEQIRAAAALPAAKDLSRSAINKLPALIMQSGLLAAAAFSDAEGGGENRKDMKKALDATATHLAERGHVATGTKTARGIVDDLSKRDSHQLQRATGEALAFIAYLKRFAPKD